MRSKSCRRKIQRLGNDSSRRSHGAGLPQLALPKAPLFLPISHRFQTILMVIRLCPENKSALFCQTFRAFCEVATRRDASPRHTLFLAGFVVNCGVVIAGGLLRQHAL